MISSLFNSPGYQGVKAMMDLTAARQQAIASNISNLETPNYKRIDVSPSFESELKSAISAGDPSRMNGAAPSLAIDHTAKPNREGNTVQLEDELMKMSANTLAHQLETKMVSGTLMRMRLAITGRGGR